MTEGHDTGTCDMRGMLSFTILWLLAKRPMYGQELAAEIGKRRGDKPNPGTIYPALKDLASRGMIEAHSEGRNSVYRLTGRGEEGLGEALRYFRKAFGDMFDSAQVVPESRKRSRAPR
jgi:PadR family transcriptional regulator, regulatory protein PadR